MSQPQTQPRPFVTTDPRGVRTTAVTLPEGGGVLLLIDDPAFPGDVLVRLKLEAERRPRELGVIRLKERVFCCERRRSLHLMKTIGAYAFCHYLLTHARTFDSIYLLDTEANEAYLLPREWVVATGRQHTMRFKRQGQELQLFIPLSDMQPYRQAGVPAALF